MFLIAFFVLMQGGAKAEKPGFTVQGRVYMGQDGLVLETYTGEIYFLRGRNLGQFEGEDVLVEGQLRHEDAGLMIIQVSKCEVVGNDFGVENEAEEEFEPESPAFSGNASKPSMPQGSEAR